MSSPLTVTDTTRRQDVQHFRAVMIFLAFSTVAIGVLLKLFHARLPLTADEARDVATLFLLIGVADTLVLYNWEWIFGAPDTSKRVDASDV